MEQVLAAFDVSAKAARTAEELLAISLPAGSMITFRKGNMLQDDDAKVLAVDGRRIRIQNQFSKAERWIDVTDITGRKARGGATC